MAAKKRRRRKHAGLVWRILFGTRGPTKRALKKAWADMVGPKTIASIAHDPVTGKLVTKNLVVDKRTGQISMAPKKKPAKTSAAKKGVASRASKASQASRAGQPQRRTAAAPAAQAPRLPKAKPMSERAIRNADGTFDGSKPDPRKAAREYQRIMRHVETLNRQTDRDLGWNRDR